MLLLVISRNYLTSNTAFYKKDKVRHGEALKQELSAAVEGKEEDMMSLQSDDANVAGDDDSNPMEQEDDDNSEVQSNADAQCMGV